MNDTQTVRSIVERYLSHCVCNNKFCPEALADRQRLFRYFLVWKHLGDRLVVDCCADDLAEMIDSNPLWKATNTKRSKAHQVNACFNWAVRMGRLAKNPFLAVHYDEGGPRKPTDNAHIDGLMERACLCVRRLLWFQRENGCRPCELRRVLWEEMDWERGIIVHQKSKTRKKTKKPRIIYLTPASIELLKTMRAECDGTGHIFRNTRGNPWKKEALVLHWQRLRRRAHLPMVCTMAGIRHRVGTDAVKNGGNIKLISIGLGHASVTTTERFYVQVDQEYDVIRREMMKSRKA